MFAKYTLGPLWEIYEGVSHAAASVGLKSKLFRDAGTNGIAAHNKRAEHAKIDATTQKVFSRIGAGSKSSIVSAVLRRYRPLSDSILDAVCETGPSPADAASRNQKRVLALQIPCLLGGIDKDAAGGAMEGFGRIRDAVQRCDPGNDVPTMAHVCKFTSTSRAAVTNPDLAPPSSTNTLMGRAHVLSGNL